MRTALVPLGLLLGCPALALTPQQQAALAPPAACQAPAGAQAGDLICPAITPDGWHLTGILYRVPPARAMSAYTLSPGNAPRVSLAVTSPGYGAAGAATTISRTVVATVPQRLAYPTDSLPNEAQTALGTQVLLALSDWVHAGDTATVTALAGAYLSGGVSSTAVSGRPVANRSAMAHWRPICAWVTEGWQRVTPGNTLTLEAVCIHARPRAGRQVAAVTFTATDGAGHAATCTSTAMTQSTRITGGNPVAVYSCGIAIPAAGWTAGAVTVDLAAYPWVGDQVLTASGGADGVPIAAGTRTPNLHPLTMQLDAGTAYAPAYAWVQAGGTCLGAGCTSAGAADPGTGNAANYPTVYRALLGCQAYNNANRGHQDEAGCVVRLRAGTYAGYETSYAYSMGVLAQYAGPSWASVEAAPGEGPSTVTITSGAYTALPDRVRFRNVTFTPSGSSTAASVAVLIGNGTKANTNPIATEYLFDGVTIASKAVYPIFYGAGLVHFYNSTLDEGAGQANLLYPYGVERMVAGVVAGNVIRGAGPTAAGTQVGVVGALLGNQATGRMLAAMPTTSANFVQPTGPINAFNRWMASTSPHDVRNTTTGVGWQQNYASVQNVYEKTGPDGLLGYGFLNDDDLSPFGNYVSQYETTVGDPGGAFGGRRNILYGDIGPGAITKLGVRLFDIDQNYNAKRDTFTSRPAPGRTGTWAWDASVGGIGNLAGGTANGPCSPNSVCWYGEYFGLLGATGTGVTYVNNLSTTTGGGDYHLAPGSAAANRVPAGLAGLPFDLGNTPRRNDGTGAAGAYEGGQ